MKKLSTAAGLTLLALSGASNAYVFEGNFGLSEGSTETEEEIRSPAGFSKQDIDEDTSTIYLQGEYYFQDITTDKGPWHQAAFLSKASSVGFSYEDETVEQDGSSGDVDYTTITFSGRQVFNDKFVLEQSLDFEENDGDDAKTLTVLGGAYIDDHQEIVGGFIIHSEDEDANSDIEYWGLQARYQNLLALGDKHLHIRGALTTLNIDNRLDTSIAILNAGVAFYPMSNLEVSADLGVSSSYGEDDDIDREVRSSRTTFTAGISYFITEQFNVYSSLSTISGDSEDEEDNIQTVTDEELTGAEFEVGLRFRI